MVGVLVCCPMPPPIDDLTGIPHTSASGKLNFIFTLGSGQIRPCISYSLPIFSMVIPLSPAIISRELPPNLKTEFSSMKIPRSCWAGMALYGHGLCAFPENRGLEMSSTCPLP